MAGATSAYFDFVDHESEAFRLVFESDLRNEPAVRERFERVERGCVEAITETIMADTGIGRERAELLAAGLCGAAEIAARFWLTGGRQVPKAEAEALLSALSWRGIASFPLQGERPSDRLACVGSSRIEPEEERPWRSRSAFSTRTASWSLESAQSPADVAEAVTEALADPAGVLTLVDEKGRQVIVPVGQARLRRDRRVGRPQGRLHRQLSPPTARRRSWADWLEPRCATSALR